MKVGRSEELAGDLVDQPAEVNNYALENAHDARSSIEAASCQFRTSKEQWSVLMCYRVTAHGESCYRSSKAKVTFWLWRRMSTFTSRSFWTCWNRFHILPGSRTSTPLTRWRISPYCNPILS